MAAEASDKELIVTRVFDAPRALVFEAWTTREHLAHWWGPKGYTLPFCELDFRPGGKFRLCMRSPEGGDFWVRGVFREIVVPDRIVWIASREDKPGWERLMTTTFEDEGGKTRLTVRQGPFKTVAERDGAVIGWSESLERLAIHVAGS
jgi:uncharacterized protein YndB with AHSA1/START domain